MNEDNLIVKISGKSIFTAVKNYVKDNGHAIDKAIEQEIDRQIKEIVKNKLMWRSEIDSLFELAYKTKVEALFKKYINSNIQEISDNYKTNLEDKVKKYVSDELNRRLR